MTLPQGATPRLGRGWSGGGVGVTVVMTLGLVVLLDAEKIKVLTICNACRNVILLENYR